MATTATSRGAARPQQRQRTRKALLEAAARAMQQGAKPTLEEVAAEALVSRATAYRYFPSLDALYLEAAIDIETPSPAAALRGAPAADPAARLEQVDAALAAMIRANESALRMMLARTLERSARGAADGETPPLRQNRRTPLIEAALEPSAAGFAPAALARLKQALALVIGPEAVVVCKDVLRLGDAEARRVRRWAIRALVEAAAREGRGSRPGARSPGVSRERKIR